MTNANSNEMLDLQNENAFRGTLSRRAFAFLIDWLIVGLLIGIAGIGVFFLGLITIGLGWYLFPILGVMVALFYFGATVGGEAQASYGMRAMGLTLVRLDGARIDFMTAAVHQVLFWILNSVLTPFVLLVGLFTDRNRLLHDILLGTAMADRQLIHLNP